MTFRRHLGRFIIWCINLGVFAGIAFAAFIWLYLIPRLPDVASLRDYHLQTPLRVMTRDGKLISEFGEKRRMPLRIDQVPDHYLHALLAAEDKNFYHHHGVDMQGIARAMVRMIQAGGRIRGGGSTITMQVARNYLLTLEQTFSRKINEILLSLQIERELSKNQILEMYFNKMFMGHRAYGVEAAAQVYYGRHLWELSLAEQAMIAGLYKAPSRYNPIANPARAKIRRNWILDRMLLLGYLNPASHQIARQQPITARFHSLKPETQASYVAEMVRQKLVNKYPIKDVYTGGYQVYTSVDSRLQDAARFAVQKGLLDYDQRHGFRGITNNHGTDLSEAQAEHIVNRMPVLGPLQPGIVRSIDKVRQTAHVMLRYDHKVDIHYHDMTWMRPRLTIDQLGKKPDNIEAILKVGDEVHVREAYDESNPWILAQIPDVQGALVALDPKDGAVIALVGGFEYLYSKFNRATQALRQPGSSFKPFIYASALEQGFSAASLINDAPVVFNDASLEDTWRPENYSGKFFGPTRLRQALYQSRNLVSIRILREIGIASAINYATRFGFKSGQLPRNLSLALGSGSIPPIDLATAYTSLANTGYAVKPYFIERIEDNTGRILYQAEPTTVCHHCEYQPKAKLVSMNRTDSTDSTIEISNETIMSLYAEDQNLLDDRRITHLPIAERIMDRRVNYIMHTILKDVIKHGTGRRALALERYDLAGKTGTTNDQKDAWFSGYTDNLVATAWVGFDQPQPLGRNEFGSTAALPIWIDFMGEALKNSPQAVRQQPNNMVSVRIDKNTGLLASEENADTMFEIFRIEHAPTETSVTSDSVRQHPGTEEVAPEELF